MALAPNLLAAMRAAPRPPLPAPITRKSVSLEMGAMLCGVEEKCLENVVMREAAVFEEGMVVVEYVE